MQDAAGIDTADRPAAGAETDDVEAVQCETMAADAAAADQSRLAVDDQADVGAGAAHVERDQVAAAEEPRCVAAAGDATGGAGQHAPRGEPRGLGDWCDTAVRLDDQDRASVSGLHQALLQPPQVARQRGPDIGVHHGGGDAVELLDLRQHVGRQRHVGIGHRLGERGGCVAFVARIAIGVQVADRHCFDAGALQRLDRGGERRTVERGLDRAVGAHAFRHAKSQRARHELFRRRHAEVVPVVLQALAHLDDVAVALRGEQADPGALVLEQCVGCDRGAVHDALGLREQGRRREVEEIGQAVEPGHHADRRVFGCRGDLCQCGAAGVIHRDQVGEGAADVDADLQHGRAQAVILPLPLREGVGGRGRCQWE